MKIKIEIDTETWGDGDKIERVIKEVFNQAKEVLDKEKKEDEDNESK